MINRSRLHAARCRSAWEQTHAASLFSLTLCALLVSLFSASAAAASPAAPVGVSVDFLWQPDGRNDTQVYLHVSNMAFKPSREQLRGIYNKIDNPESNLPVMLFMAAEANVSLSKVWRLRSKGLTWVEVMVRLGIPQDRLFVDLGRQPGPPYGKAYGHWKRNRHKKVILTDDDVYYWVNIHAMSRYFGVPAPTVVKWREEGRAWKALAGDEFRRKKGGKMNGKQLDTAGMDAPRGHGDNAKGKGKDKKH